IFEADHADDAASAAHAVEHVVGTRVVGPTGETAGALPYVDRALRLGTPDALLNFHAAVILDAAGQRERARAEIGVVMNGNPWFSARYHDLAQSLARKLGA